MILWGLLIVAVGTLAYSLIGLFLNRDQIDFQLGEKDVTRNDS